MKNKTRQLLLPKIDFSCKCLGGGEVCENSVPPAKKNQSFVGRPDHFQFPKLEIRSYCDLDDVELVRLINLKNDEAGKELFGRYQKKLFAYVFHLVGNKDEAEDILQGVFLKTFKNLEYFDTSRKFSSWIYRIAHNEAVNFLKRKSKRYTVSWDEVATSSDKLRISSSDELLEDKYAQLETVKDVKEAMEKLPEKYRRVLRLRYFKEFSYEDIGKLLGKPVNTVGTLINRAKKKLLKVLQERQLASL